MYFHVIAAAIFISVVMLLANETRAFRRGARKKPEIKEEDIEFRIRFRDLDLKILCEEEEWKAQFETIRKKLTKCLGFKKIITEPNDPEDNEDIMSPFQDPVKNPYCKKLNCIEPDGRQLLRGGSDGFGKMIDDQDPKSRDPEHMNYMARAYKVQCELAQFSYNHAFGGRNYDYGGFGGMDYYGDEGTAEEAGKEAAKDLGDL